MDYSYYFSLDCLDSFGLKDQKEFHENDSFLDEEFIEDPLNDTIGNSLEKNPSWNRLSDENRYCGFLAVIGEPNAGKSTLVNALTGQHVSLVSRKAHATRFGVYGIVCQGDYQCVFVDTPGFLRKTAAPIHRAMNASLKKALDQSDATLLLIDASMPHSSGVEDFLKSFQEKNNFKNQTKNPINQESSISMASENFEENNENPSFKPDNFMIVLNKIDLVSKEKLLELATYYQEWTPHISMISAKKEKGLGYIKNWVLQHMPKGPWLFSPEDVSQISQRTMAAEITRECLLDVLHEEIPYHLHVVSEKWTQKGSGVVLEQQILLDNDRYRRYVLGHKGQRIKHVGIKARRHMEKEFGHPVHLYLTVKTDPQWCQRMDQEQG